MSLVAKYKLISNSNDSLGLNNGTDTAVSYSPATFNGTTSLIDFGNPAAFNFGSGLFTAIAVFKTSTVVRRTILQKFNYDGVTNEAGFVIDVLANGRIRCIISTNQTSSCFRDSTITVNDNSFHSVAFVRRTINTIDIYIDGTLSNGTVGGINVSSVSSISNTFNFKVGYQSDNGVGGGFSQNWDGQIKNVQLWNEALTQDQIITALKENSSNFFQFF